MILSRYNYNMTVSDNSKNYPMNNSNSSSRFINRETSWLAFNTRVLEEAENTKHPLMERLNFLAISASNLDEFYMVRVAGLKDYVRQGITKQSPDGMAPAKELEIISSIVAKMVQRQHACWLDLRIKLEKHHIKLLKTENLTKKRNLLAGAIFSGKYFSCSNPYRY